MTTSKSHAATMPDGTTIAFSLAEISVAATRTPPRVVLIHSLALDRSVWRDVIPRLAPAQVLSLDCRGHGRSSRSPGPYTVERFGDDVAAVLDHVGWSDEVVVAGCSMGGCVAQAFAARHPRRVRALALIDTTAWYGDDAPAEWRQRGQKARTEGLESMAAFQVTRWFGDAFRAANPARVKEVMDIFIANDLDCYAAACEMLGNADLRRSLSGFNFPTAVVVGEQDYATPIPSARSLRRSIPGASLRILPGARHLTPIECPQMIAEEIRLLIGRTLVRGV